ncbi:zinc-ribbon domain-containing protein [Roseococcus sp. YIM B11640]|uniref:zinc-ribbon domain-containing protein n=1 Tax=Roseococcus sp. YIM B11640 TaxID=3133973 RepID=UPI003C7A805B
MRIEMDINCPACAALYRVPESMLASGRPLRCGLCQHEWVPARPAAEPAAMPVSVPVEAPPPPPAPPPPEPEPPSEPAPAPAPTVTEARPAEEPVSRPLRKPPPLIPSDGMPPPTHRGPPHLATRRLPETAKPPARRAALPLAWIASVAAVLVLVACLVLYRAPIAAAWPPFARLAGLLGG